MTPPDAKDIVDLLCDRSPDEREAWFAEHATDPAVRARVEQVLAHFDVLVDDSEALPGPELDGLDGAPPQPGEIGPYRILDTLGSGGMGVVYRGVQADPRREVAVKVLRGAWLTQEARRRFEREAAFLARLQHPGIAQVIELGRTENDDPYLVLEYIDGRSLTTYAERGALDQSGRLRLLIELAEAVHHAHLRGVVHRDLKPGNVLVTADGQVKVIDFGVARALDDELLATRHTRADQVIGTLAYMAPEQLEGGREVDARVDVYALGVLAYELLGGRLPLDLGGLALAEAARRVADVDPPRLGVTAPACRGDLEWIVGRALAKDPERRYASAAAFAADLRRFLAHETVEARPPTITYQLGKLARRHRGFVTGAGVALLAIVVGAGVAVDQALENKALADREAEARRDAEDSERDARDAQRAAEAAATRESTARAAAEDAAEREATARQAAEDAAEREAAAREAAEDAAAAEEVARHEAEDAAARELAARQLAERRNEELQRLATVLGGQLASVDPHAVGEALHAALLLGAEDALARAGVPAAERGTRVDRLRDDLALVDLNGVSLAALDAGLFAPAADRLAAEFDDDLATQARLLRGIAHSEMSLDLFASAERHFLRVRELLLEHDGAETPTSLATLLDLAHVVSQQGRLVEAVTLVVPREAELTEALAGTKELGRFYRLIAFASRMQGDLGRARRAYELALDAFARPYLDEGAALLHGPDLFEDLELIHTRGDLGLVLCQSGRFDEGLALMREALDGLPELEHEPRTVAQARQKLTADIGEALCRSGRGDEGEAMLREAIASAPERLGEHDQLTAVARAQLGVHLASTGRPEEARELLTLAVTTFRRNEGSGSLSLFEPLLSLTGCEMALGRPHDALPHAEAAAELTRTTFAGRPDLRVPALLSLRAVLQALDAREPDGPWHERLESIAPELRAFGR